MAFLHSRTAAELAEALGVSVSTITSWRSGRRHPDVARWDQIIRASGYRMSYEDIVACRKNRDTT
ncbi:MAG: helix-turn-helix domain-containing protein [Elioraea sp.]|nr:helix-turn-helix domain-containing protein [Elioraea sp.]